MSDNIKLKWLLPKKVTMQLWELDLRYDAEFVDDAYVLNVVLDKDIEIDMVHIYMNWELFDDVWQFVSLRKWDTLHLEYIVDVW